MRKVMECAARMRQRLEEPRRILSKVDGLGDLFVRCFLNTLETTFSMDEEGGAFVITGDIPAMWLRDSTQQVLQYVRFAKEDGQLAELLESQIARQMQDIITDPYANAFNRTANGARGYEDWPTPHPRVWERKYELDSLCHAVLLAWRYFLATGKDGFLDGAFFTAMEAAVQVIALEQEHEAKSGYRFQRFHCPPSDTLAREGKGTPTAFTGMSWCGFRPSDDACAYGYLVPANLFAAAMLEHVAFFARRKQRLQLEEKAAKLARDIREGVERHGTVRHPAFGRIYAYEADGLGHCLLMDDANIPSLLSLPYLGAVAQDDPTYLRTRAFVLSRDNPMYFVGKAGRGIGSPHTPADYIWPIGLCIQAMTTQNADEIAMLLRMLHTTHGGTGWMHEGFHKDRPWEFTREWFAWANSMFGEMVYRLYEQERLAEIVEKI